MVGFLRGYAVTRHVPEVDREVTGEGVREWSPQCRRPRCAVAEDKRRSFTGCPPGDPPAVPPEGLVEYHASMVAGCCEFGQGTEAELLNPGAGINEKIESAPLSSATPASIRESMRCRLPDGQRRPLQCLGRTPAPIRAPSAAPTATPMNGLPKKARPTAMPTAAPTSIPIHKALFIGVSQEGRYPS